MFFALWQQFKAKRCNKTIKHSSMALGARRQIVGGGCAPSIKNRRRRPGILGGGRRRALCWRFNARPSHISLYVNAASIAVNHKKSLLCTSTYIQWARHAPVEAVL